MGSRSLAVAFIFFGVVLVLGTAVADTSPTIGAITVTETVEPQPQPEAIQKAHVWVKTFLVKHAPPGRKLWYPGAEETKEDGHTRYDSIATDIVETAFNPNTKPIFKSTVHGRSMMAAVWMGIALHESGFMKNVDKNIGKYGRGDRGRSWCIMQMNIGKGKTIPWNVVKDRIPHWGDPPEEIFDGYAGPELIENRQLCLSEAHHLVRDSFKKCKELPLVEHLTGYAAGSCTPRNDTEEEAAAIEDGKKKSRARMRSAIYYFGNTKLSRGFRDTEVLEEVRLVLAQRAAAKVNKQASIVDVEGEPIANALMPSSP